MRLAIFFALLLLGCSGQPQPDKEAPTESVTTRAKRIEPDKAQSPPEVAEVKTPEVAVALDESAWVDLLQSANATVAASSAYKNKERQVTRLFDGDLSTAWNSKSLNKSDSPPFLMFELPAGSKVHALEMTTGYTKIKGDLDLFTANRRVTQVTIERGEASYAADLNPDNREFQRINIPTRLKTSSGPWKIVLAKWVDGTKPSFRELSVSELRVLGETTETKKGIPNSFIGSIKAEPAEAGDEDLSDVAGEDFEPENAAVISKRTGFHVKEILLGSAVERRKIVSPGSVFTKGVDERVYCLVRFENPDSAPTMMSLAWEDPTGHSRKPPKEVDVPGQHAFTHYRYTSTSWRTPGPYRCVIRNSAGEQLAYAEFTLRE